MDIVKINNCFYTGKLFYSHQTKLQHKTLAVIVWNNCSTVCEQRANTDMIKIDKVSSSICELFFCLFVNCAIWKFRSKDCPTSQKSDQVNNLHPRLYKPCIADQFWIRCTTTSSLCMARYSWGLLPGVNSNNWFSSSTNTYVHFVNHSYKYMNKNLTGFIVT